MMIDRFVRFLLPRQDFFFTLLEEIAAKMLAGAAVFGELTTASDHEQIATIAKRLKAVETEADDLCHRVFEELDKTFVTPIDREDLSHLTKALDDVIDGMEHSAAFMALFRFPTLTEPMRRLVGITCQAAAEVSRAIGWLRKFSDAEAIHQAIVKLHTLENEADIVFREAIEALFADSLEAKELIRRKDMLLLLEAGVDCCEAAMDVIRSVIVKNG